MHRTPPAGSTALPRIASGAIVLGAVLAAIVAGSGAASAAPTHPDQGAISNRGWDRPHPDTAARIPD